MMRTVYTCNRCGAESNDAMKIFYAKHDDPQRLPDAHHLCASCSDGYEALTRELTAQLNRYCGLSPLPDEVVTR